MRTIFFSFLTVLGICGWGEVAHLLCQWGCTTFCNLALHSPLVQERGTHGQMKYKDTKPYMSAFLSVHLLTDFATFCLTDFKDWRYIHSWFVFSTQLVNCCPHGRRNYTLLVYCCPSTVPSLWPPSPSPPSQWTLYTDSVWLWGGGWWNVLWTIFCRSFTLCFWPDSEPTKFLHHP